MNNPPAINVGGLISTADYQLVVQGTDLKTLYGPAQELEARLRESRMLQDVNTSLELRNPEIQINILRDRAAALGVSPQQIETSLYNAYGGRRISTLYGATDQYSVMLELDPRFQRDINALRSLLCSVELGPDGAGKSRRGHQVERRTRFRESLRAASFRRALFQPRARRFDRRCGCARAGPGARSACRAACRRPSRAAPKHSKKRSARLPLLLLVTILVIYMVLAILYEHYGHPITILTALPFAGFGALLMLMLFSMELNVFSFVGIILLVGLVKKNGIMMVDFALQLQREQGSAARRSDRGSMCHSFPSDHDDDDGRDFRDAAARAWARAPVPKCASRSASRSWAASCSRSCSRST